MSERRGDPDPCLAEIDRRLEAIQAELRPGQAHPGEPPPRRGRAGPLAALLRPAEPQAAAEPLAPIEPIEPIEPAAPPAMMQQMLAMSELQERLIIAIEQLLDVLESGVHYSARPPPPPSPAAPAARHELTVSAGPFEDTEALRAFEGALADLPGVRQVDVRGYAGVDQAVFVIELDRESRPDVTP